jgi:hypothetical protein
MIIPIYSTLCRILLVYGATDREILMIKVCIKGELLLISQALLKT